MGAVFGVGSIILFATFGLVTFLFVLFIIQQARESSRRSEAARVQAEMDAEMEAERRAKREKEDAERQERWRRETAEREARERPVIAFIHVVKFIAQADRRFGEAEQLQAVRLVEDLYPGVMTKGAIVHHLTTATIDLFKMDEYVQYILPMTDVAKASILAGLEDLAKADGKATKAEIERIAVVRVAIGLSPQSR